MTYHFNKDFIPAHTLAQQLEAWKALLDKRDKAWADQWAATVLNHDEASAFDELQEAYKQERKRP